jgi:lipid A 3-O-deacylase
MSRTVMTGRRPGAGRLRALCLLACGAALLGGMRPAGAQQVPTPSSAFVQAGSMSGTRSLTVGLAWDGDRRWGLGSGELGSYLELALSRWRYDSATGAGEDSLTQVALTPVFRWRPDAGASPWFLEAGVGLSLTSKLYETPAKRFSTSFNFGSHLGVGRNFGTHGEHELSLRAEHFSNAGIRHPNPGENFVEVRYAYRLH